jgi:hypothetical protein
MDFADQGILGMGQLGVILFKEVTHWPLVFEID